MGASVYRKDYLWPQEITIQVGKLILSKKR